MCTVQYSTEGRQGQTQEDGDQQYTRICMYTVQYSPVGGQGQTQKMGTYNIYVHFTVKHSKQIWTNTIGWEPIIYMYTVQYSTAGRQGQTNQEGKLQYICTLYSTVEQVDRDKKTHKVGNLEYVHCVQYEPSDRQGQTHEDGNLQNICTLCTVQYSKWIETKK